MDQPQTLVELLLQKGVSPEVAKEIAAWAEAHQPVYYYPPPTQGQTAQDWISAILKEPEIVKLLHYLSQREEKLTDLDNADEKDFRGFLSRLDLRQKIYNLGLLAIGAAIIWGLKVLDVIPKETAATLITIIIGATLADAISNYYKAKDKE